MTYAEDLERQLENLSNASPCLSECLLEKNKVCRGCGRTPEMIKEFGDKLNKLKSEIRRLKNGSRKL